MNRGRGCGGGGGGVFLRLMANKSKMLNSRWHDFRKARKKEKKTENKTSKEGKH